MSGRSRWIALGALAAVIAAALAFVGTPLAHAVLAVEGVALVALLLLRQERTAEQARRIEKLLVADLRERRQLTKALTKELAKEREAIRSSMRSVRRERSLVAGRLEEIHRALDGKVAHSVEKLDEKLKAEVRGLAAAIRDREIETGLDALNRYSLLADQRDD